MTGYSTPGLPDYYPGPITPRPSDISRGRRRARIPTAGSVVAAQGNICPIAYGRQSLSPMIGPVLLGNGGYDLHEKSSIGIGWICCIGPIEGFVYIYGNGQHTFPLVTGGLHGYKKKFGYPYYNFTITQYEGLPGQVVDPVAAGMRKYSGNYSSTYSDPCIFDENGVTVGQAYLFFAQNKFYDEPLWVPTTVVLDGLKTYDPRSTLTEFSTNPVLHIADYVVAPYGANLTIDWDSVGECANRADELIDGKNRYRGGYLITDAQPIDVTLERMRALAGVIIRREGKHIYLVPDKPGSSVFTFNTANIVKDSARLAWRSVADKPSQIKVKYIKAKRNDNFVKIPWLEEVVSYPGPGDPGYSANIDDRRIANVELLDCQDNDVALRYAKMLWFRQQEAGWQLSLTTKDMAAALLKGEHVTVDHPLLPSATEFLIRDIRAVHAEGGSSYSLTLEQYSPNSYDDTPKQEDPPHPDLSEPPDGTDKGSILPLIALEDIADDETLLVNIDGAPDNYCRLADAVNGYPAQGFVPTGNGGAAEEIVFVTASEGIAEGLPNNITSGPVYCGTDGSFDMSVPAGAVFQQRVGTGEPVDRVVFNVGEIFWLEADRYHPVLEVDPTAGVVRESARVHGESPGGWLTGCAATRNTATSYNVSAGQVALIDPSDTTRTIIVASAGATNRTPHVLTANAKLFVYIDVNGAVGDMLSGQFTHAMIRDRALIAEITLDSLGTIVDATDIADFRYSADRIAALAVDRWISEGRWEFPESGFLLGPKTSTIQLILSSGVLFHPGINNANPRDPNRLAFSAQDPMTFDIIIRDDSLVSEGTTSVNVTNWDNNGTLSTLTNNRAVMHVVYVRGKNNYLQLGQDETAKSVSEALANFDNLVRAFVTAPSLAATGTYIAGAVFVLKGATDLSVATQAAIVDRTHFSGNTGGGGGGDATGAVKSVNQTYPDADGNVEFDQLGIGTSSPIDSVTAYVLSGDNYIRFQNQVTGTGSDAGFCVGLADGTDWPRVWGHEWAPIIFGTYNTERARFQAGGVLQLQVGLYVADSGALKSSAIFEISSTEKGFLPPKMTSTQRTNIASPATSLIVDDTTLNALCRYNGTAWEKFTTTTLP